MKCTWPTPAFCVGTQRNLYSTDWRRGLALGVTQILELGNAKIYQHVGISNANPRRQVFCVAVEYRLNSFYPKLPIITHIFLKPTHNSPNLLANI